MSAKGRKKPQQNLPNVDLTNPLNYYSTEVAAVRAIAPHVRGPGWQPPYIERTGEVSRFVKSGPPRTWLDAGCGKGEIGAVLHTEWPNSKGFGVELDHARAEDARAKGLEVFEADWLFGDDKLPATRRRLIEPPEAIITNGPFDWPDTPEGNRRKSDLGDMWAHWVEVCKQRVAPGGEVAALGRLGVLQAQEFSPRDTLFEGDDNAPQAPWDLYVLAWRVSFTGDGGTDSQPVGWFIFGPTRTYTVHRLHRDERDKKRPKASGRQSELLLGSPL